MFKAANGNVKPRAALHNQRSDAAVPQWLTAYTEQQDKTHEWQILLQLAATKAALLPKKT